MTREGGCNSSGIFGGIDPLLRHGGDAVVRDAVYTSKQTHVRIYAPLDYPSILARFRHAECIVIRPKDETFDYMRRGSLDCQSMSVFGELSTSALVTDNKDHPFLNDRASQVHTRGKDPWSDLGDDEPYLDITASESCAEMWSVETGCLFLKCSGYHCTFSSPHVMPDANLAPMVNELLLLTAQSRCNYASFPNGCRNCVSYAVLLQRHQTANCATSWCRNLVL